MAKQLPFYNSGPSDTPSIFWKRHRRSILIIFSLITVLLLVRTYGQRDIQADRLVDTDLQDDSQVDSYNIDAAFWPAKMAQSKGDDRTSAYTTDMFIPEDQDGPRAKCITAVILRVTDDDNSIQTVVQQLLKYPFIQEILIYNAVTSRPLSASQLNIHQSSVPIEIISSYEPMQSLARFTTCASSATFAHCYFQDDRTINRQLDTLYTNFLRYPSLIHVNGNPQHYLNAMRWRISNPDIYMHAGYADLRYGAFVPRWKVQNFLTQLGKSGLSKERLRLADIYFTLWTNQYPWIVADPSMATETDKGAEIENFDRVLFDAMRRLQHVLEADTSDTPKDYIERLHESPALGNRDVKAACFNGQCLFTTNIDPFPVPHHVHFNASDMPSLHALENAYNSLDEMDVGLWTQYSFEKAVDQNKDTCWNTYRNPKAGDYFGLIIVGSIQADQLSIFSRQPISNQHDTWQVYVMQDDNEWITCRTSILDQSSKSHDATLQLDCGDTTRFRAIRVVFAKDQSEPFKLCGLRLDSLAV